MVDGFFFVTFLSAGITDSSTQATATSPHILRNQPFIIKVPSESIRIYLNTDL
jgi:hypothetical protein